MFVFNKIVIILLPPIYFHSDIFTIVNMLLVWRMFVIQLKLPKTCLKKVLDMCQIDRYGDFVWGSSSDAAAGEEFRGAFPQRSPSNLG